MVVKEGQWSWKRGTGKHHPLCSQTVTILNSLVGFQVTIRKMSTFCKLWLSVGTGWGHVSFLIRSSHHDFAMLMGRQETEMDTLSCPQPGRREFNAWFSPLGVHSVSSTPPHGCRGLDNIGGTTMPKGHKWLLSPSAILMGI